jgi:hypothetical protein
MSCILTVWPPNGLIWPGSKVTAILASDSTVGVNIGIMKGRYTSYSDCQAALARDPSLQVAYYDSGLNRDWTGAYAPIFYFRTMDYFPDHVGDFTAWARDIITDIYGHQSVGETATPVNFTVSRLTPYIIIDSVTPKVATLGQATVGSTFDVTGRVRYIDPYTLVDKPVYQALTVDITVTSVLGVRITFRATVDPADSGRWTVTGIPADQPGGYVISAISRASGDFNTPILPWVSGIGALCPTGTIYDVLKSKCTTPAYIDYKNILSSLVKEGVDKTISGTLKRLDGTPIGNAPLGFDVTFLDGTKYGHADLNTNPDGTFSLVITTTAMVRNSPLPEIMIVTASTTADITLMTIPLMFTVYSLPVYVKFDSSSSTIIKEGDKKTVSGTLQDLNGNVIKSTSVHFDVKYLDGTPFIAAGVDVTTDAGGKFSFDVDTSKVLRTSPVPEVIVISPTAISGYAMITTPLMFTVYSNSSIAVLQVDTVLPSMPNSLQPITGHVYDVTTSPIPNAPVTLYDPTKTKVSSTVTDINGKFTFSKVNVGNVQGLQTIAYLTFDGIPATATKPSYPPSPGLYPVDALIFQPSVFINPNLYSPLYVSSGWINSGVGVKISGLLQTISIDEMGNLKLMGVGANEPVTISFTFSDSSISLADMSVMTKSDGSFEVDTGSISTTALLTLMTAKISYTGSTYFKPAPVPATVLIYKAIFGGGGGGGGTVAGIPLSEILIGLGIVAGGTALVIGAEKAKGGK